MIRGLGAIALAAAALTVTLPLGAAPRAAGLSPAVYSFPAPGTRANLPGEQIAFRGQNPRQLVLSVRGSQSGLHHGTVELDSDGQGGSFIPNSQFAPGETVTVQTAMNIVGGSGGTFHFQVAVPGARTAVAPRVTAPRVRGDVERFRSRPDLAPSAIRIVRQSTRTAKGDLFLAPEAGPVQDGPMIRDWRGTLLWYKPVPANQYASDFRVQRLHGRSVLTWWQGYIDNGVGSGEDVITDGRYQTIAVVHGANGVAADEHEFQLTHENTALITAYYPIYWNESPVHGPSSAEILDSVVQEIDIPTGLVLFEWHALDHISLANSVKTPWKNIHKPWDYLHVNSVQELGDHNLLISGRNTSAIYKVNRHTSAVAWSLGGRHSSFRMGAGTRFNLQHDARMRAHNLMTIFDDEAGPPAFGSQSRVLGLHIDTRHRTASLAFAWGHSPSLLSYFEGNVQQLGNGDYFTGWGLDPYFSEFNSSGRMIFDGRFVANVFHYRSYRFRWNARPNTLPRIAASTRGGTTTVWASWNGATGVKFWRVYAGSSSSSLHSVKVAGSSGFETAISIGAAHSVAVVALDSRHRPMSGRSAPAQA